MPSPRRVPNREDPDSRISRGGGPSDVTTLESRYGSSRGRALRGNDTTLDSRLRGNANIVIGVFRLEARPESSEAMRYASPLIAVVLTLIGGLIVFAALGKNPLQG